MGIYVLTYKEKAVTKAKLAKLYGVAGGHQKAVIAGTTAKYVKEEAVASTGANDWRELSKQGFAVEQVA